MGIPSDEPELIRPSDRTPTQPVPNDALCDVNERCLDLLIGTARMAAAPHSDFIAQLREPLCALGGSARTLAAGCPFLLVDMQFRNAEWWRAVSTHPTRARDAGTWLTAFPRQRAVALTRAALVLAWYTARTDRDAAVALFGLAPPVSDLIATLPLPHIDRVADRHFRQLRPRWEDRPAVWRQLLISVRAGPEATGDFALRGLQLMAGDWLSLRQAVP